MHNDGLGDSVPAETILDGRGHRPRDCLSGSFRAIPYIGSNGSQVLTDSERSWEQRQVESLMDEIADRLRPICARMPVEEFDQLVEGIARLQRKWQRTEAQNFLNESRWPPKELE